MQLHALYIKHKNACLVVNPWLEFVTVSPGYAAGPIVLRFHSDDIIEPDQELGFDITYQQLGTGCMRALK
jgi:hypothetical protein